MAGQEKLSQKCRDPSLLHWEGETAPAGTKGPGSPEFDQPISDFDNQFEADAHNQRIADLRNFAQTRHTRPI
ncbi:MAG: hypothetical protein ABSE76_00150 [Minisyncoccia bacterium]|jgi:hypothetical protein